MGLILKQVEIYRITDIFFMIFHTSLIMFNLTGWIWKRTRTLNLVLIGLTGISWLVLGLIVGTLGYCPLTDWHFRVLEKLGQTGLPDSYIKYLADRLTGMDFNAPMIDKLTLYVFLAVLVISVSLNIRDFHLKRHKG